MERCCSASHVQPIGDWRARFAKKKDQGGGAAAAPDAPSTGPSTSGGGAPDAEAAAARKAARKAAKAAAAAAAAAAMAEEAATAKALNFKDKPDLKALSVGLPPGWIAMWEKASGDVYYGNPTTKVMMRSSRGGRLMGCYLGWGRWHTLRAAARPAWPASVQAACFTHTASQQECG